MKKDKWFWIKLFAAIFGASYASIKDLILWLREVKLMSLEQTIDLYAFRIIIILSVCYGIFLFVKFLYNLYKTCRQLCEFRDGQIESYHKWLETQPTLSKKPSSLELKIQSMFRWLSSEQKQ